MTAKKNRFELLSVALFLLGCLGGFFLSQSGDDRCIFNVTVETDNPVEIQLFYDTGRDFNEEESQRAVVYNQGQAVTLSFMFPGGKLRRLRFDPARSVAAMCIWNAGLTCEGKDPFNIAFEKLIPQQGILLLRQEGARFCFKTEGDDPILHLDEIGVRPRGWTRPILYSLGGGIFLLLGTFSLVWLYKRI